MLMRDINFAIEPFSQPLGEVTVSAELGHDTSADQWDVLVLLTRKPDQAPVQGCEVDAQLLNEGNVPLKELQRPTGPLVEAGGGLGMTANALFRFQDSVAAPTQLVVTYRGQTAHFRIVATD
jgi:hypothetical protein